MGLNDIEKNILRRFVEHINRIHPDQIKSIRLYGSKARGDYRTDSDIDILLLVDDRRKIDRDKIYDFIVDAELEHGIDISLNIYNVEEFERMISWDVPFAVNVSREGETLWPV